MINSTTKKNKRFEKDQTKKQVEKGVQVDFTIVENGEEIFSTVNCFNQLQPKRSISKHKLNNIPLPQNNIITQLNHLFDGIAKEIENQNWRSSCYILAGVLYMVDEIYKKSGSSIGEPNVIFMAPSPKNSNALNKISKKQSTISKSPLKSLSDNFQL